MELHLEHRRTPKKCIYLYLYQLAQKYWIFLLYVCSLDFHSFPIWFGSFPCFLFTFIHGGAHNKLGFSIVIHGPFSISYSKATHELCLTFFRMGEWWREILFLLFAFIFFCHSFLVPSTSIRTVKARSLSNQVQNQLNVMDTIDTIERNVKVT